MPPGSLGAWLKRAATISAGNFIRDEIFTGTSIKINAVSLGKMRETGTKSLSQGSQIRDMRGHFSRIIFMNITGNGRTETWRH